MSLRARRGERPNAAPRLPRGILSDGGVGRGALSVKPFFGQVRAMPPQSCCRQTANVLELCGRSASERPPASRSPNTMLRAASSAGRTVPMVPSKGPSGQGMRIDKFFQPVAAAPSVKPMDVSDAAHSSAKRPLGASGAAGSSKRLAKVAEVDSPMLGHATPASLHTEAAAKRPISASEGAGPSSANAVGAASRAVGAAIAASSERRESPLAPGGAASSSKLVPVAPGPVPGPATAMARCPLPDQSLSKP